MAEYRAYLATLGMAAVLVAVFRALGQRMAGKNHEKRSLIAFLGMSAAVTLALAMVTVLRTGDFQDTETLWTGAAELSPRNARAQSVLGDIRVRQGRLEEAARYYRRATPMRPLC